MLPASALGTASEDYYPTVAINALMRLLRDPSMASHQQAVTQALFNIFRTLGLACVPYLPKVGAGSPCMCIVSLHTRYHKSGAFGCSCTEAHAAF